MVPSVDPLAGHAGLESTGPAAVLIVLALVKATAIVLLSRYPKGVKP